MGRHIPRRGPRAFRVVPWIPLLVLPLALVHLIWGVLAVALLAGRHAAYAADLRRNRFPASACLILFAGGCAVRRGAAEFGMALCAGQRGMEGAGVSRES